MVQVLQVGAHRGGGAATDVNLQHIERARREPQPMTLPPLEVQVTDLVPVRSQALAQRYLDHGIPAVGMSGDARTLSVPSSVALAIHSTDDPVAQCHLLNAGEAHYTLTGLLGIAPVSSNAGGGLVFGIGGAARRDDYYSYSQLLRMNEALARMAGERRHSTEITSPLFSMPQVDAVRSDLYRTLGSQGFRYLTTGDTSGGMCISVLLPERAVYPLEIREREKQTRREMERIAKAEKQAIAYVDGDAPWMFLTLPSGIAFELPISPADEYLQKEVQEISYTELRDRMQRELGTSEPDTTTWALGGLGLAGLGIGTLAGVGAGMGATAAFALKVGALFLVTD